MAIFRKPWRMAICVLLPGFLTACGAWQSVKDTTTETTRAVFIAKVKQMTLVIASRAALNQDPSGVSLPVVLRIYQLKDSKAFSTASYTQLLSGTGDVFNADILARTEVTLSPAATLTLSEPMSDDARYIGVVAFFPRPDERRMATGHSKGAVEEDRPGEARRDR